MAIARLIFIFLLILPVALFSREADMPRVIDLSGEWYYRMHNAPVSIPGEGTLTLPGTLDSNHKSIPASEEPNTSRLTRKYSYAGSASYFKTVDIPLAWRDAEIELFIERTRPSTLFVDGEEVCSQSYLSVPHVYDLTGILTPGEHKIEVVINNLDSVPPSVRLNSNTSSEYTQTNWNGMTGEISLRAWPEGKNTDKNHYSQFPDHSSPNYTLKPLRIEGNRFTNGSYPVFLRGTVDSAVFPLTAYAPTDIDYWRKYFDVIKSYGLNHVRFHSWCPPEAAFVAADNAGVYLQVELPVWGELDRDYKAKTDFLMKEMTGIINEYSRHPSFAMLSLGNELWGDISLMKEFADTARELKPGLPVTFASNLYSGMYGFMDGEDFVVASRLGRDDDRWTDLRASFSYADLPGGGILNSRYPSALFNYDAPLADLSVPVITHEVGQYQSYPDYSEIALFTGDLEPTNLREFERRSKEAGIYRKAPRYLDASLKWAEKLYKAEMEAQLRSGKISGFQLMALQDYPGQGTANVGMTDLFLNPKPGFDLEAWLQSCNDAVILAEMPRFTFFSGENVSIPVKLANYSGNPTKVTALDWSTGFASGSLNGFIGDGLSSLGKIFFETPAIKVPTKFTLILKGNDGLISNAYDFWVYPRETEPVKDVWETSSLDNALVWLREGKKVLLTPDSTTIANASIPGLFTNDFWNYRMYRTITDHMEMEPSPGTLGLLIDDTHPAFKYFPTENHTDWQWYPIVRNSRPLITDRIPDDFDPIVEVIDNTERNYRLGLMMECNVGKGKLMIISADMEKAAQYPEGKWLLQSVREYMASKAFKPKLALTPQQVVNLLTKPSNTRLIRELKNETYDPRWE